MAMKVDLEFVETPEYETEKRFWDNVNMLGTCWDWTGRRDKDGYGLFQVGGKTVRAHRFSYLLNCGPIPDGMSVLHVCDRAACVRGDHLGLGTHRDNMADMVAKGRQAKGDRHVSVVHPEKLARGAQNGSRLHPEKLARGQDNGSSKLTEEQVKEIRRLHATGGHSQAKLSTAFGVSHALIAQIVKRKVWKHVT